MNYQQEFLKVLNNNTSGSTTIINIFIALLIRYAESKDFTLPCFLKLINQFKNKFFNFSITHHLYNYITENIQSSESKNEVSKILQHYHSTWKNVNETIFKNFAKIIALSDKTILTHSNSSTIQDVLLKCNNIKVIQTTSEPAKEGIIQAKTLAEKGLKVTLITDALLSQYIQKTDFVILGTDAISNDFFINKSGSLSIAIACNYYKKPIYVLADSRKIISNLNLTIEEQEGILNIKREPEEELIKKSDINIEVQNYYFEKIPNKMVTKFFFEDELFQI